MKLSSCTINMTLIFSAFVLLSFDPLPFLVSDKSFFVKGFNFGRGGYGQVQIQRDGKLQQQIRGRENIYIKGNRKKNGFGNGDYRLHNNNINNCNNNREGSAGDRSLLIRNAMFGSYEHHEENLNENKMMSQKYNKHYQNRNLPHQQQQISRMTTMGFDKRRGNFRRFISLNIELDEDEHDEEEDDNFEWINEDFVNPQNIVEGSQVKILTEERFFHNPKLNKLHPDGFCCKDLVAKVKTICIENKDGVICSANRPVIVQFEEPVKFTAHFGFAELDLVE